MEENQLLLRDNHPQEPFFSQVLINIDFFKNKTKQIVD
jgi:hypothetical protein